MQHSERVERLWLSRLRWRLRGAWLWPAFFGATPLAGILLDVLPPYEGTPPGLVGCLLLVGFVNLFLIAVAAPLGGRVLRRWRPDLPRPIAADYVGAALVSALAVGVLAAGIAHRPAIAAEKAKRAGVAEAAADHLGAPARAHGLDVLQMEDDLYRACVPGADAGRWLCVFVATDTAPPSVRRDREAIPNEEYRRLR